MKFRVAPKDFVTFLLFCIFLLYLCAIAVLNFTSFMEEFAFAGLNPFPAFVGDNLIITLIMFFTALLVIFTSVSSYIFDRQKGHGIGLKIKEKEEKGYSRWSKDKEIKEDKGVEHVFANDKHVNVAGIPLINNGHDIWVDNGDYHNLIIGSTGSGKTQTIVKPMVNLLAKKGESMIITDPKGEIYEYSAEYLKEQGYKIIVLNFRDPKNGNAWNPLTLPYQYYKSGNMDKSTELLDDVGLNIIRDPNNKGEPFWENSAADYFSGLALGLFMDAKEEEVNMNSINYMSSVGEERFAASTYIKEYFHLKGESSSPYIFASGTINAPKDTQGGITSTFRQKIRTFASREILSEMLSYSDFDMRDIGKEKTAVFMIIHDEKTTYHSLLTIFIKQCYETLIDVAKENGGKLPFRTNFILDEFANMPPLKDVDSMVSAARSRDIRFTFIIQNFAQLNDVYGKEVAEVIKGNCGNWIYLISTEMAALEEISKMCGEVKSKEKDKTASTPLVTVTDLQKLKLFEAIIIRLRKYPFRTKLEPDYKMNWGIERKPAILPKRETKEVQLFDVKTYVTEEKRKNMLSDMDKNKDMPGMGIGGNMSPFSGVSPFPNAGATPNPFMKDMHTPPSPFGPMSNNPFLKDGPMSNEEIDRMIADIDKKLKELDEEEAREKEKLEQSQKVYPQKIEEKKKEEQNSMPSIENMTTDDIDRMIADIDKKLKELDEEEEKLAQQEESDKIEKTTEGKQESLKEQPSFPLFDEKDITLEQDVLPVEEMKKPKTKAKKEQSKENNKTKKIVKEDKLPDKPKINIDVDSVIVNDNIITDDEFFDDFFGDE